MGVVASLANNIAKIVPCSSIDVSRGRYRSLSEELRDTLVAWLALHGAIAAIVILSEVNTSGSLPLIVVIRGIAPLRITPVRNLVMRRWHHVLIHIRYLKGIPWVS